MFSVTLILTIPQFSTELSSRTQLPSKYATTEERDERYEHFKESLVEVDILNAAEKADKGTAVFGITILADLSPEEYHSQYLGTLPPNESERALIEVADVKSYQGTVTSVDWTGKLTTPIKDQGGCGSCW